MVQTSLISIIIALQFSKIKYFKIIFNYSNSSFIYTIYNMYYNKRNSYIKITQSCAFCTNKPISYVSFSLFCCISVLVNVQRQLCNRLRQHSHAGVRRNDLHCRAVIDSLSCMSPSEEIAVGRDVVAVLRLVP